MGPGRVPPLVGHGQRGPGGDGDLMPASPLALELASSGKPGCYDRVTRCKRGLMPRGIGVHETSLNTLDPKNASKAQSHVQDHLVQTLRSGEPLPEFILQGLRSRLFLCELVVWGLNKPSFIVDLECPRLKHFLAY